MPEIIDDKSEHCVPFILDRIKEHREASESKGEKPTPFFVGLNGVQGAGKTTLVCRRPTDSFPAHSCISKKKDHHPTRPSLRQGRSPRFPEPCHRRHTTSPLWYFL